MTGGQREGPGTGRTEIGAEALLSGRRGQGSRSRLWTQGAQVWALDHPEAQEVREKRPRGQESARRWAP